MIWEVNPRSAEHVEQRSVSRATRDNRVPAPSFDKAVRLGGELDGVVAADEFDDSPDDEEEAECRRENGSLKVGSRYTGKMGLVAEMPLSRTISIS